MCIHVHHDVDLHVHDMIHVSRNVITNKFIFYLILIININNILYIYTCILNLFIYYIATARSTWYIMYIKYMIIIITLT